MCAVCVRQLADEGVRTVSSRAQEPLLFRLEGRVWQALEAIGAAAVQAATMRKSGKDRARLRLLEAESQAKVAPPWEVG